MAGGASASVGLGRSSFKASSFLGMAPRRPSFTRSSSASSTKSTKSEDSFITSLKALSSSDQTAADSSHRDSTDSWDSVGGASSRPSTPVTNNSTSSSQSIDDTPGRKRSQPIAIELPARNSAAYTPLSARGDLPGGYFPNHEALPKPSYNPHPFSKYHQEKKKNQSKQEEILLSPTMSNNSSALASPSQNTTPRGPPSIISPSFPAPEILTMPMGKYHPANYKPAKPGPTSGATLTHTNMFLPSSVPDRKKKTRPTHERHGSDVKRKLQEYQLGQMKQAQMLAQSHGGARSEGSKPVSPRLLPLGSPGPITPFELEDNSDAGYIVAGARARTSNFLGMGLERGRDRELVGRMIREEEDRRVLGQEGSQSPILRV